MIKTLKKVMLSSLAILGMGFVCWTLLLFNPSVSYANKTSFDFVTVYHNQELDEQTEVIISNAIAILRESELFSENTAIDLCLNDDEIYPHLHAFVGQPTAYALLNKTIIKNCKPKFNENVAETQWAVNDFEFRKFNLTWLLAHEFTHNLQYKKNLFYVIKNTLGKIDWKLEGHAEYIAREFRNDGELKSKISTYLVEEDKEQLGLPVFELEDGTKQILNYYKYAIVTQYLIEERKLNFNQICELDEDLEMVYQEMIAWSKI